MLGPELISFVELERDDDARPLAAGPQPVAIRLVLAHEIAQVRDLTRAAGAEIVLTDVFPSVQAAVDAVSKPLGRREELHVSD